MIMLVPRVLENYLFARKVCKKYKLKFKVLWLDDPDYGYFKHSGTIGVNPSSHNFYTVFFHELGHSMDYRVSRYMTQSWENSMIQNTHYVNLGFYNGRYFNVILHCEAKASRYARRLAKSCGKEVSTEKLLLWFTIYFKQIPECLSNKLQLANMNYKLTKYLIGK